MNKMNNQPEDKKENNSALEENMPTENFTENEVYEIFEMEFDSLEEWYKQELTKLKNKYKKTFTNFDAKTDTKEIKVETKK